ncbi:DUF2141 domain-containing protein [Roseomonas aeriglobus]|nr:DUF2141 domain-containing protein [Roseomonas aeriglobus]
MIIATLLASAQLTSSPDLGKAAGACRTNETRPSLVVEVAGLRDRKGLLKLELYPDNDADFLADDNALVAAGKAFARVEAPVPATGPVHLCIRAPRAGTYAVSLLHDRDADRKFGLSVDGIGFTGNPKLRWAKPAAASARVAIGAGPTPARIVLNYRHGLFTFRPD